MKSYTRVNGTFSLQDLLEKDLGNNHIIYYKNSTNFICGWKSERSINIGSENELADFDNFINKNQGEYIFSGISYDLKNSIYPYLESENEDRINFPIASLHIFQHVLIRKEDELLYFGEGDQFDFDEIPYAELSENHYHLKEVTPSQEYENHFNALIEDIQFGNIYEINYCIPQHGSFEKNNFKALESELIAKTRAPFGAIWNTDEHYILSASPERFLRKKGYKLISQPIKGTKKRGETSEEDLQLIEELRNDPKERSENIMIVDLVRNALSQIATKNSVKVNELCGIYTFETVHQMISTVTCDMKVGTKFSEIIAALFPMGSMTGAPKISAMKISEREEKFKRGIYSGALGFIEPNGNFDFNVVIRSFIANKEKKTFTVPVGGAITIRANAESEYAECLLKLDAIKESLS